MSLLDVILTGIALSMDAFAITIANCATYKKSLSRKNEWTMPVTFAIFQGLMPLIGFFLGSLFYDYIKNVIGYVTSAIFFLLTIKIIIDIIKDKKKGPEETQESDAKFTVWILLVQAFATSIDALAVGITLVSTSSIILSVGIIALVTLVIVTIALLIGKFLGTLLGKYANYLGAILLFVIAVKSLIEAIL